jgi:hypothetical protein
VNLTRPVNVFRRVDICLAIEYRLLSILEIFLVDLCVVVAKRTKIREFGIDKVQLWTLERIFVSVSD